MRGVITASHGRCISACGAFSAYKNRHMFVLQTAYTTRQINLELKRGPQQEAPLQMVWFFSQIASALVCNAPRRQAARTPHPTSPSPYPTPPATNSIQPPCTFACKKSMARAPSAQKPTRSLRNLDSFGDLSPLLPPNEKGAP